MAHGLAVLVLILAWPACGFAAPAEALVRDSATALSKLHSYELSVVTDESVNDGRYVRTMHTYFDAAFDQAGGARRIRIESKMPADSVLIVGDDSGHWVYHENNRHYERRTDALPAEAYSPTPEFPGPLSARRLPSAMQSAELVRQETLTVGDRQELCDVVVVQVRLEFNVKGNTLTMWLSREYLVPMKLRATFVRAGQAMEMTVTVTRFHPNAAIEASTKRPHAVF